MTAEHTPRPPRHLRPETRKWVAQVLADYELEPHHVRLLVLAGEAFDRCQEARERLAADGTYITSRLGDVRLHPAARVEESSRIAFARLVRELDLAGEPLPEPTRPPRRGGR